MIIPPWSWTSRWLDTRRVPWSHCKAYWPVRLLEPAWISRSGHKQSAVASSLTVTCSFPCCVSEDFWWADRKMPPNCAGFLREKWKEDSRDITRLKQQIQKRFPITGWLPHYTFRTLEQDIVAGLSVGLMVVPQSLAYALLAGLPPQYGLYSAFMGCFVYCILGTSKDITLGPTALMSLLVFAYGQPDIPALTVALTLWCGIIQLAMGFLRLGFIVHFISTPILSGFTSAAAIIIGVNQLKDILGLKNIPRPFFKRFFNTLKHIGETRPYDVILGMICLIVLLALRKLGRLKSIKEVSALDSKWKKVGKKLVFLLVIGRNALVVLVAAVVALILYQHGHKDVFSLTGEPQGGLPPFQV